MARLSEEQCLSLGIWETHGGVLGAEEGAWVRVKIGPYSGDLGKVVSVDYNSDTARVKVLPLHSPFQRASQFQLGTIYPSFFSGVNGFYQRGNSSLMSK